MKLTFMQSRLWTLCCSLKLTIVLASSVTLVVMLGSLQIPGNPHLFSLMDEMPLGNWLSEIARRAPELSWWVPLAGLLLILLMFNTLCCFIDWAFCFRSRWRKTGEYLIHLGFVLIVIAYIWGGLTGYRSAGNQIFVGQTIALKEPGHFLRLEAFEPLLGGGRPMDMLNTLVLLKGETELKRAQVRINHPLTWDGLVILPASFGRSFAGYKSAPSEARKEPIYKIYSILTINNDPGANLALVGAIGMGAGVLLTLGSFYRKRARGEHPNIS